MIRESQEQRRKNVIILIFVCIFFISMNVIQLGVNNIVLQQDPAVQVNSGEPTAYAIVIGIEDYPDTYNDLSYCHDDMQQVRRLLVNEMGYIPRNIYSFYNSRATKDNILNKLEELQTVMTEEDTLFIFYSGHGDHGYVSGGEHALTAYESPHDYYPNMDQTWTINHPGADAIRVHFSKIRLEDDYDYIFIGDENIYIDLYDIDNCVFEDYYTGSWDGDHPYSWSYWVYSDTLKINLLTDSTVEEWGFKADKYEIMYLNKSSRMITHDGISEDFLWGSTID
ncbi:MAG: hypothetical protein GF364_15635 [Candidatus Lokiarchaeota archaeon]|nr:hypothetical protein [Candidatus Lokiarchaeota archaeon]